jgi:transcriptional regulator GlxA family with amidase domain
MGARHFNRRFKAAIGVTPARFVEIHRLDAARERLASARTNVAAVATSVGYRTADVFARAFQRRFGVAPADYRARFATIARKHAGASATK